MRHKLLSLALTGGLLAEPVSALELLDIEGAKIDSIVEMPISGMSAVESDGQILYVSDNGRFVLTGQMYDLWYKSPIDSMRQVRDVATRIDMERMGFEPGALNTVTMGSGDKEVVMFTDPLCEHCHALAHEAKAFTDEYTFNFIVVPALGDESNHLAKRVACAADERQALDALLNGTLETLPTREDCDFETYDMTLLAAQVMEVDGVPFLISDDGRVSRGRPQDFADWLGGES